MMTMMIVGAAAQITSDTGRTLSRAADVEPPKRSKGGVSVASRKHPGSFLLKLCLTVLAGVLCTAQMCAVSGRDTDGDGVPDAADLCPTDPDKTAPKICGCGVPETDTDGDGAPDCIDQFPNDPNSIFEQDDCGCGG